MGKLGGHIGGNPATPGVAEEVCWQESRQPRAACWQAARAVELARSWPAWMVATVVERAVLERSWQLGVAGGARGLTRYVPWLLGLGDSVFAGSVVAFFVVEVPLELDLALEIADLRLKVGDMVVLVALEGLVLGCGRDRGLVLMALVEACCRRGSRGGW